MVDSFKSDVETMLIVRCRRCKTVTTSDAPIDMKWWGIVKEYRMGKPVIRAYCPRCVASLKHIKPHTRFDNEGPV